MASVELWGNRFATEAFVDKTASVSSEMFGAISTALGGNQNNYFEEYFNYSSLNLIRWPGGTLSEIGKLKPNGDTTLQQIEGAPYAYDLKYPELIHPAVLETSLNLGEWSNGFSDILRMAIEKDASLSLIIPTQRHIDNPQEAYSETSTFLKNLFVDGIYNNGETPRDIILDIGNEYYEPSEYGRVAFYVLMAVNDFRSEYPDIKFKTALQVMGNGPDSIELINALTENSSKAVANIDAIRLHSLKHELSSISEIEDRSKAYWSVKRVLEGVRDAKIENDVFFTGDDVDLYVSAWTVTSNDVEVDLVAGLPGASAVLSLFTGLIQLGADMSAAWGIAAGKAAMTSLSFIDDRGIQQITSQGQVYAMMSANIVGLNLLETNGLITNRSDSYNMYAFTNSERTVIYVAANDLQNDRERVVIDLLNFGSIANVKGVGIGIDSNIVGATFQEVRDVQISGSTISFDLAHDYDTIQIVLETPKSSSIQLDTEAGIYMAPGPVSWTVLVPTSPTANLFGFSKSDLVEVFKVTGLDYSKIEIESTAGKSGLIVFNLSDARWDTLAQTNQIAKHITIFADNELNNIIAGNNFENEIWGGSIADRLDGHGGNDNLHGGGGADVLKGGGGADTLFGEAGDDTLFGSLGDDLIFGGTGNDVIDGGYGNDTLTGSMGYDTMSGGAGADIFEVYGRNGVDTITDFCAADGDRIDISQFFDKVEDAYSFDFTLHSRQIGNDLFVSVQEGAFILENVDIGNMKASYFIY